MLLWLCAIFRISHSEFRIRHLKGTFVPSYIRTLLILVIPHSAFPIPHLDASQRSSSDNKDVVGR